MFAYLLKFVIFIEIYICHTNQSGGTLHDIFIYLHDFSNKVNEEAEKRVKVSSNVNCRSKCTHFLTNIPCTVSVSIGTL